MRKSELEEELIETGFEILDLRVVESPEDEGSGDELVTYARR